MEKLEHYFHEGSSPVPTLVASALCESSTLDCLTLSSHAVDSLASFATIGVLKKLVINCCREKITERDMLPHAPITVAQHRRTRTAVDPGPTVDETVDAIVDFVAQNLHCSASTITQLELTHWESGDWLEKLNRRLESGFSSLALRRSASARQASGKKDPTAIRPPFPASLDRFRLSSS